MIGWILSLLFSVFSFFLHDNAVDSLEQASVTKVGKQFGQRHLINSSTISMVTQVLVAIKPFSVPVEFRKKFSMASNSLMSLLESLCRCGGPFRWALFL